MTIFVKMANCRLLLIDEGKSPSTQQQLTQSQLEEATMTAKLKDGYWADDGNCAIEYPGATSGRFAADLYVDGGDWGDSDHTSWVTVYTWRLSASGKRVDEETHKVPIEPLEPECSERSGHNW